MVPAPSLLTRIRRPAGAVGQPACAVLTELLGDSAAHERVAPPPPAPDGW
jgi:hypothetical protein